MLYLENWDKEIKYSSAVVIALSYVAFMLLIAVTMFSRVKADSYYNQAMDYLKKIDAVDDSLLVERILLYRKGLNLLEKASKINPKNSKYSFGYGQILTRLILDESSSNLSLLSEIRGIKNRNDLYNLALSKYSQAIILEPTLAVYHLKQGWVYELLNSSEKAENEFAKAILLDPTNLKNHIYLVKYFLSRGKEVEAFFYACQVRRISKGFSLGEYEGVAAKEFTEELKKGSYSRISFKNNQFLLSLSEEDLPLKLEYPLDLLLEAVNTDSPLEIYVYVKYFPQEKTIPFKLALNERQGDILSFVVFDLYHLAKDYAKQKRWNVSTLYLEDVRVEPKDSGVIQGIQLIFSY